MNNPTKTYNDIVKQPINLSELDAEITDATPYFAVATSGREEAIQDCFELHRKETVLIVDERINNYKGNVAVYFRVKILSQGPTPTEGGNLKVKLPVIDPTAPVPADDIMKAAQGFYKFLCAVDPRTFAVEARIDKSTDTWVHYDWDGNVMSYDARKARAEYINGHVYAVAERLADRRLSFVGYQANVKKVPSSKYPEHPFLNWSPAGPIDREAEAKENSLKQSHQQEAPPF